MFTVYLKNNSTIFRSGFITWQDALHYGKVMFGPWNFEIEREA